VFALSRPCRGGSVKPSADPALVRTRHLPLLSARESRRDQDHPVRSNEEAQSPQALPSRHIASHLRMLCSISQRNAASRSPASADAQNSPVLDLRSRRRIIVRGIPNGGYACGRAKNRVALRDGRPVSLPPRLAEVRSAD
jgi:hypothetical protein